MGVQGGFLEETGNVLDKRNVSAAQSPLEDQGDISSVVKEIGSGQFLRHSRAEPYTRSHSDYDAEKSSSWRRKYLKSFSRYSEPKNKWMCYRK